MKITCTRCGKQISVIQKTLDRRIRQFKNKEDFNNNFKCQKCKRESKIEKA